MLEIYWVSILYCVLLAIFNRNDTRKVAFGSYKPDLYWYEKSKWINIIYNAR
jgi:hypothetical protein